MGKSGEKRLKNFEIRHNRIVELRNMTVKDLKNGKSREQIVSHLKARCAQVGVSKPTTSNYIDEVFNSLLKRSK